MNPPEQIVNQVGIGWVTLQTHHIFFDGFKMRLGVCEKFTHYIFEHFSL